MEQTVNLIFIFNKKVIMACNILFSPCEVKIIGQRGEVVLVWFGFLFVALVVLELTLQTKLASHSEIRPPLPPEC